MLKTLTKILCCVFLFSCIAATSEATTRGETGRYIPKPLSHQIKKKLQEQERAAEYERVNRFYQRLNKKERRFLNNLCSAEYVLSYYKTLKGFSHSAEITLLRNEAEENLRKLKKGKMYSKILKRAGNDKSCLIKYILCRVETGENDAHIRNAQNKPLQRLKPKDVFYSNKESNLDLGKTLFLVIIGMLVAVLIVGLAGAFYKPEVPVFQSISRLFDNQESLLEY